MSSESRTKTITNPKSCFLDVSYTSGSSPSRIERILTNYFKGRGFEVKTGRMAPGGVPNDRGILQVIKSCSFGIVVYNEFRHNVGYEWGLMDALGMPVIPFRDKNTHIDFDKDFSDKKGITFVQYSGDSDEKEIIKELEGSESLKAALENVERRIGERVSHEETEAVKEVSRLLTELNIPLGAVSVDKERHKFLDIAKALETAFSEVSKLTSEGHFYRAIAYYYAEDAENAEKEYKKTIRINPNLAEAHYNLAVLLQKLERYAEAEREYRETIRCNPDFAEAHSNIGNLLTELKRHDDAEKEYREAIRINPYYAKAHNNLGNLLTNLRRFDEAKKELKEALRINPNYAEAHNNFGVLLNNFKKFKKAEKEYRQAISLKSEFPEAYSNLGNLLTNLRRFDEAEEVLKEAIKINPDYADAHYNLGILLQKLERGSEAETEYKEAIRSNPDYAEAHGNLGNLYSQTGRVKEAKRELETAKRLFEAQGRAEDVKKAEELLKTL